MVTVRHRCLVIVWKRNLIILSQCVLLALGQKSTVEHNRLQWFNRDLSIFFAHDEVVFCHDTRLFSKRQPPLSTRSFFLLVACRCYDRVPIGKVVLFGLLPQRGPGLGGFRAADHGQLVYVETSFVYRLKPDQALCFRLFHPLC